jgi:hypothetical protein
MEQKMFNIQSRDTNVNGWNVRVMQLESLGWAACLYSKGYGRIGEYVFGDTQDEVIEDMRKQLPQRREA